MNFYRATVSNSDAGNITASYTVIDNKKLLQTSLDYYFSGNNSINDMVIIGNNVKSCRYMLAECNKFNQNVNVGRNVVNCEGMLQGCKNFNSILRFYNRVINCRNLFDNCGNYNQNIHLPDSVEDCSYAFCHCYSLNQPISIPNDANNCREMFYGCAELHQDFIIPKNVAHCEYMFYLCNKMRDISIYINGNPNVYGMFKNDSFNSDLNVNIYSNLGLDLDMVNSIVYGGVSWEPITNGYRNRKYNIYLYNNYIGT